MVWKEEGGGGGRDGGERKMGAVTPGEPLSPWHRGRHLAGPCVVRRGGWKCARWKCAIMPWSIGRSAMEQMLPWRIFDTSESNTTQLRLATQLWRARTRTCDSERVCITGGTGVERTTQRDAVAKDAAWRPLSALARAERIQGVRGWRASACTSAKGTDAPTPGRGA